jgi:hypothetical protein
MDKGSMAFFWAPECSSCFPGVLGAKVDDARDGNWRCCFMALLYLAATPAHMGVDVEGLAYPLHRHVAYGRQTRGQGLLPGAVLSCRCNGAVAHFQGCEAPGLGYLVEY